MTEHLTESDVFHGVPLKKAAPLNSKSLELFSQTLDELANGVVLENFWEVAMGCLARFDPHLSALLRTPEGALFRISSKSFKAISPNQIPPRLQELLSDHSAPADINHYSVLDEGADTFEIWQFKTNTNTNTNTFHNAKFDSKDQSLIFVLESKAQALPTAATFETQEISVWLKMVLAIYSNSNEKEQIKKQVYRDGLTDLYNIKYLETYLDREIKRCRRFGGCFSLLFFDLDDFKGINDQYGHEVGNRILKDLVAFLRHTLRGIDTLFRYGGDEFVVLLVGSDRERSEQVALRIIAGIRSLGWNIEGKTVSIGCSYGIAAFPECGDTVASLIGFADNDMYNHKRKSKYSELEAPGVRS